MAKKQNIDVLLDDVDENMSNKFKKHDIGDLIKLSLAQTER